MNEGHHTLELIWKGVNILAFLFIVYWFGRKPISQAFQNFFNSLTERLTTSELELSSAKEELQKAKQSLEDAQRRYKEQLNLAHETAKYIREEEEKRAQEIAQRIKEKAKEVIDIELKKAKEELVRYGHEKATQIALQTLKERFEDPQVQKAYIQKSLRKLEAGS